MKKLLFAALALVAAFAMADTKSAAENQLKGKLPGIFARAAEQYRLLLKNLERVATEKKPFPKRWENGELVTIPPEDWCSGFFPGAMWYLYEYTRDGFWRTEATKFTAIQDRIRHYTGNHDIGFMLMTSVGNALRLDPRPEYPGMLLDGAEALTKRYSEKLGLIRSWGKIDEDKNFLVIVDNLMNLELMQWAAKNGGGEKYAKIAKSHADKTSQHHFRADGSAYHVLNYNQHTPGKILEIRAGQGASVDGTWARGHSWAIYGYTMLYRETTDRAYLMRAIKSADYLLEEANVPADGVPSRAHKAWAIPHEERDTSAAAIETSALLELSQFVPPEKLAAYRAFAVKTLLALSSDRYFAKSGEQGGFLLTQGVGHKPGKIASGKGGEVNVPLNYGDYYFLEALIRFNNLAGGKSALGK